MDTVDLMQIYPGITNNLDILSYGDTYREPIQHNKLCCLPAPKTVKKFEQVVMCTLLLSITLLVIGIACILFDSNVDQDIYLYFIALPLVLTGLKLLVLGRFVQFRAKKNGNPFDYHKYGNKFYYLFYSDINVGYFLVLLWIVILVIDCPVSDCEVLFVYNENYDDNHNGAGGVLVVYTWCIVINFFLYGLVNFYLVILNFDSYYKHWGYGEFITTNDARYCLNYDLVGGDKGNNNISIAAGDKPGNTDNTHTTGSTERLFCALLGCFWDPFCCLCGLCRRDIRAIKVGYAFVNLLNVISFVSSLISMIDTFFALIIVEIWDDDTVDSFTIFLAIVSVLTMGSFVLRIYWDSCCYGWRLLDYKKSNDTSNCHCTCNNSANNVRLNEEKMQEKQGKVFHRLAKGAMTSYSVLTVLTIILFLLMVVIIIVASDNSVVSFGSGIPSYVFILLGWCWIEYEGLKLTDAYVKWHVKNRQEGINVEKLSSIDFGQRLQLLNNPAVAVNGAVASEQDDENAFV